MPVPENHHSEADSTGARFVALWGQPTDVNAFEEHYRNTHIPLAKALPGLRRFTVSRNVSLIRGDESYYLVAELDWDDLDSLRSAFKSEAGQRTGADVANLARFATLRSLTFELADV